MTGKQGEYNYPNECIHLNNKEFMIFYFYCECQLLLIICGLFQIKGMRNTTRLCNLGLSRNSNLTSPPSRAIRV